MGRGDGEGPALRDGNFFFCGEGGEGIFFNLNGVLPGNETMIFF